MATFMLKLKDETGLGASRPFGSVVTSAH